MEMTEGWRAGWEAEPVLQFASLKNREMHK